MRREFNEMEYFNWCFGQPYNMVIHVQIRGDLQPARLREALKKAQLRHPLLRVNSEIGPSGIPWFSSDGVQSIPLTVREQAEPDDARDLANRELASTFDMDERGSSRLPLLRVAMFLPRDMARSCDLVFTVQHVIADGLSMVFLVRDLLGFIEQPQAPVLVLDAPASPEDLLPPNVRRRMPRSPLRFEITLWFMRVGVWLHFWGRPVYPKARGQYHCLWQLTAAETSRLRACCRREGVSVHSAICTAFLPGFPAVHTPVNVRASLARPVGEAVGLFVGSADAKMKYRVRRGFWSNARALHRRMRRAQRDPFRIFRLFSKVVPLRLVRQLGPLLVRRASGQRPFAITNLGQLDAEQLQRRHLKIEAFVGAVTPIIESSVLTVYTLDGCMRLHLIANESPPSDTTIREEAERSIGLLRRAIES